MSFSSAREAMASPLAKRIFSIDGVTGVFFGADFITVTKRVCIAIPGGECVPQCGA